MGIKSTQTITRERAINRILEVHMLVMANDYRGLGDTTTETDYDLEEFINKNRLSVLGPITKWTDKMLEDRMDEPFYRHSMFDNYEIRG